MTGAVKCGERREAIVALVLGELEPQAARELEEHMTGCSVCRGVRDALVDEEKTVRSALESLARGSGAGMGAIPGGGNRRKWIQQPASRSAHLLKGAIGMVLTHRRLAAAVVLAASVIIGLVVLVPHGSVAYALEQTTQAVSEVKHYHVKITPAGAGVGEAWAELNDKGEAVHMRMDFPKTDDGAKVVVLSADKADVWFKDKNSFVTMKDESMVKMFASQRRMFDPKLMFEKLIADKQSGKVLVETQEPAKKGDPVTLTVTTEGQPDRKEIYLVDPGTKLVEQFSKYGRKDGDWKLVSTIEYLDYDKAIEKSIWQPELPKDVTRIDQTGEKLGVARGDLKDEELARKVAKEFFEALIAEDYEKAGQIFEGMPGDRMKTVFGGVKWVRIVEIGEAKPHPRKETQFLQVPVKVEVEEKGKKMTKDFLPNIRAAHNQPDRWVVGGGM